MPGSARQAPKTRLGRRKLGEPEGQESFVKGMFSFKKNQKEVFSKGSVFQLGLRIAYPTWVFLFFTTPFVKLRLFHCLSLSSEVTLADALGAPKARHQVFGRLWMFLHVETGPFKVALQADGASFAPTNGEEKAAATATAAAAPAATAATPGTTPSATSGPTGPSPTTPGGGQAVSKHFHDQKFVKGVLCGSALKAKEYQTPTQGL